MNEFHTVKLCIVYKKNIANNTQQTTIRRVFYVCVVCNQPVLFIG